MYAFVAMSVAGTNSAMAQQKKTMTAQTLTENLSQVTTQGGLINLGNLNVNVSNITVQDLVNVQNVLNNAQIDILRNSLNNNEVLKNISLNLSNLLRNANLLNSNQIVVGVLSDQGALRLVTGNVNKFNK